MDLLLASYRRHATEPFLKCFQIPAPILSAEFVYEDRPVSGHRLPQLTGSDWRPLFNSCLPIQFKQTRIYQPCLLRLPSNGPSVDNNRKRLRFDDGSGGASQKSEELMLASYDEHQRSVLLWDCTETVGPTRLCQSIKCNAAPVMALHSLPVAGYSSPWLGVLTETQLLLYKS
jgi:hypothetical protein